MTELPEVLFATRNQHKVEEVRIILKDLPLNMLTALDFPEIPDVEETGETFVENALLKARTLYNITGKLTMADDSGLEVDALDGAPGIYSARYAGPGHRHDLNNTKLLDALAGVPIEQRTAGFRSVVAIVGDGAEHVVEGVIRGHITEQLYGGGGFGYDPIFVPDGHEITFAEMSSKEKNRISHRALAFRQARDVLQDLIG